MFGWRARLGATVAAAGCVVGALGAVAEAKPAVQRSPVLLHVDRVAVAGHDVKVSGWAVDRSSARPSWVSVSVDGVVRTTLQAALPRADFGKAYPALLAYHGYRASVAVGNGLHELCVTTSKLESNTAALAKLAAGVHLTGIGTAPAATATQCRAIAVGPATKAPVGYLDVAGYFNGAANIEGWTVDPDTANKAVRIVIKSGTTVLAATSADQTRYDVGAAYPTFGANHGFKASVVLDDKPGRYVLCAYAMNTSVGKNTRLGCRAVIVPVASSIGAGITFGGGGGTWVATGSAADALQAQAVTIGAAPATAFPDGASTAARVAIATRALLHQAVGLSVAPPAQPNLPAFSVAGPAAVVDEQAVMGATALLGHGSAVMAGGRTGTTASLSAFADDPVPFGGGAGAGLAGAAPVLAANGVSVQPALPAYPAGYHPLRAEIAVNEALSHLGQPYVWQASGPDTFDCSGLTSWSWAKAGVNLTHYTNAQAVEGVRVQPNQLLPGDLILFGVDLHHVGMYLGAGFMIDAPYTGAYVRIDSISSFGDFSLAVRP